MKRITRIVICLMPMIVLFLGCGPTRLEIDYGTSYELQKFNQTLNPQAEKNMEPVVGLNGKAAQNAVDKYQKEFEKSSKTSSTYQFSIGSMTDK
jgi:hypothetical protein